MNAKITTNSDEVPWSYENYSVVIEPSDGIGGLFLGNIETAKDTLLLREKKVTVVLNVSGKQVDYFTNEVEFSKALQIIDHHYFDFSVHFTNCFDFIHEHRSQGRNVLVHCVAGISRSPTIVIGYLMTHLDMNFENALKFTKEKRRCTSPNHGFVKQLKTLDRAKKSSVGGIADFLEQVKVEVKKDEEVNCLGEKTKPEKSKVSVTSAPGADMSVIRGRRKI